MPNIRALIQVTKYLNIHFVNFAWAIIECKTFHLFFGKGLPRYKIPNDGTHPSCCFNAKTCGLDFWGFERCFLLQFYCHSL